MNTAVVIVFYVIVTECFSFFLHRKLEDDNVDFLKLPPKTEKLSEYIYYMLLIVLIVYMFDSFHDMKLKYFIGLTLGSWIALQGLSYIFAIILGAILKLKEKLD